MISTQTPLHATSEICQAFDIGTGKIKMQVARIDENHIESLCFYSESISLHNHSLINREEMITPEGEKKIVEVLQSLKMQGERYTPTKCEGIATELFRRARNGQEVAERISKQLNIKIEVVSPRKEGILSFLTVTEEAKLNPDDIVVLDIGSGSFQITCKKEDQFLVYSVPAGRVVAHEFVKNNKSSDLSARLLSIDPDIIKKIQECKHRVIGIGAHPKEAIKFKTTYTKSELEESLKASTKKDLDYSDLILAKTIMETFGIEQVDYRWGRAGNTSGLFVMHNPKN